MMNATHTTTTSAHIAGSLCPPGTRVRVLRKSTGKIVHVVTEFGGTARVSSKMLRAL